MIAEYGSIPKDATWSKRTVLDVHVHDGREYELVHCSPGWEPAGSCARMRETETWAVLYQMDGATHGQHFKTLIEAVRTLDKWTNRIPSRGI